MQKNHIFSDTTDASLTMNINLLGLIGASPAFFTSSLRVENPRAVVAWCEMEGYDTHELARNVGHNHYDLTLMSI